MQAIDAGSFAQENLLDREIEQMVKRYGMRTAEYLHDLGLLNERLLAVHLTEATDEERNS